MVRLGISWLYTIPVIFRLQAVIAIVELVKPKLGIDQVILIRCRETVRPPQAIVLPGVIGHASIPIVGSELANFVHHHGHAIALEKEQLVFDGVERAALVAAKRGGEVGVTAFGQLKGAVASCRLW